MSDRISTRLIRNLRTGIKQSQARELLPRISRLEQASLDILNFQIGSARVQQKTGATKEVSDIVSIVALDVAKALNKKPQEVIEEFISEGDSINKDIYAIYNRLRGSDNQVGKSTRINNKKSSSRKARELKA